MYWNGNITFNEIFVTSFNGIVKMQPSGVASDKTWPELTSKWRCFNLVYIVPQIIETYWLRVKHYSYPIAAQFENRPLYNLNIIGQTSVALIQCSLTCRFNNSYFILLQLIVNIYNTLYDLLIYRIHKNENRACFYIKQKGSSDQFKLH